MRFPPLVERRHCAPPLGHDGVVGDVPAIHRARPLPLPAGLPILPPELPIAGEPQTGAGPLPSRSRLFDPHSNLGRGRLKRPSPIPRPAGRGASRESVTGQRIVPHRFSSTCGKGESFLIVFLVSLREWRARICIGRVAQGCLAAGRRAVLIRASAPPPVGAHHGAPECPPPSVHAPAGRPP